MHTQLTGGARRRLAAFFALVFVLSFCFTCLTPYLADDFFYAFSYATNQRCRTLQDVYYSIRVHRDLINARVVTHMLVMLFMTLPKWVFNLCNAAVLTLGAFGFYRCLRLAAPEQAPRLLALGLGLLWIFLPVFGQVCFWLTGACNYAWPLTLSLFVIEPFLAAYLRGGEARPLWRRLLLFPPAFIAGACSEHISLAMLAVCALLLLGLFLDTRRLPLSLAAALLFALAGYLTLFLAPTTRALLQKLLRLGLARLLLFAVLLLAAALLLLVLLLRLLRSLERSGRWRGVCRVLPKLVGLCCALALAYFGLKAFRGAETFLQGLQGLVSSSALGLGGSLALFGALFPAALLRGAEKKRLRLSLILFVGGLAPMLLYVVLPRFPARATSSTVLLAVLASLLLLESVFFGRRTLRRAALGLGAAVFLLCFSLGLADYADLYRQRLFRESAIAAAQAAGEEVVSLPPITADTKYSPRYGLFDLEDADGGDYLKDYYGFRAIIVIQPDGEQG